MKLSLITTTLTTLAAASRHYGAAFLPWRHPGHNDSHGLCPMMNTLIDHGYILHDGKKPHPHEGLYAGLNFNASLGVMMFDMALIPNREPNATFLSIKVTTLNRHNVVELDANLSRSGAFFGDNQLFNSQFNPHPLHPRHIGPNHVRQRQTRAADRITRKQSKVHVHFENGTVQSAEVVAPVVVLGDMVNGTVDPATG